MSRFIGLRIIVGVGAVAAMFAFGVVGASGADAQHGIGFTKGCASPTAIGQPYTCSFGVQNVLDEAQDTLTINSLVDVVHASGGDVGTGMNILPAVRITTLTLGGLQSGATCTGGTGDGSLATPYTGVTMCTLPFGSRLQVLPFSHYTVQPNDFNLAGHNLRDDASLTWHDLCNDPAHTGNTNCNPNPPDVGAASLSQITQLSSSTATQIHNAAHQVVTAVGVGTTVHDFVTVTGQPGRPTPTGNVNVDWFLNGDCSGAPAVNSGPVGPLNAAGQFDATAFAFTVNSAGFRAFKAHYPGDTTYTASDGPCEPLRVVDANIQITPQQATNPVGTNHTLTGHVNVNDGTGFVNAPAGTVINFTIQSGPGSFVGGVNMCTTVGATGSCTVQITSATTGTTVVRAATDVAVAGVALHRETGDGLAGDSPDAQKVWQFRDANIQITPQTATNAVGTNHTLTGHVNVNIGAGDVNAPDGTLITFSIVSGPGSFVGANTCTTTGGTGSCTVQITSATTGTTVVKAATDVTVNGVSLHRETGDNLPGDSPNAQKVWVNANIQITPATADNPVATQHVLTITVNALNGTLAAGTATASIVSGPGTFVGSPTCSYAGGGTTASCTVTITSLFSGTTEVSATSVISVAGQSITRTTNTAVNTAAGGSGNALKNWTSLGSGRVTGGGSIFATVNGVPNVRVTHGFELRCTPNDKRQSLEINWDGGNNFHLSKIINSVVCFDDPTTSPPPPPGTVIDTYAGNTLFNGQAGYHGFGYAVGTGTCNKLPAMIWFILIDAGEPGTADIAEYHITGGCTLDAGPALIMNGNHQFHKN